MGNMCGVCGDNHIPHYNNILTIKNVPNDTFNFSEKTIDLNIITCDYCGTTQLYNVPISDDYDVVYRSIRVSSYREDKKKQLKNFIEQYDLGNKTVIEIGCGDGQFLEIFRELNLFVDGLEIGKENYIKCIKSGFNVINDNVYTLPFNSYDVFCTFHYLEHLIDPLIFMCTLYDRLSPNGIGLIEVPDYDLIEKNNVWLEFTKDHRYYYNKRTLSYLLLKAGFEIDSMISNIDTLCLTAVVRKPIKNNFQNMKNQVDKDLQRFKILVDNLQGDLVIFGAGHYSQLLCNLIYDKYKIKPQRIFDSNKQKCGNKILDVIIEHKDDIKDVENYSCIIIAGIYNDEIYESLKNKNFKEVIKWN